MNIELNYKRFVKYLQAYVKREGIDKLLAWFEKASDVATAPASTKYHLSCEGGLIQHSLNVFLRLIKILDMEYPKKFKGNDSEGKEIWEETCPYSKETIAIVALLHDISKVNYYKKVFKNVQNQETGIWEKVPSYVVRDESERINYGSHEENSVYMLTQFIKLTYEEQLAIRYHMGTLDSTESFAQNRMMTAYKRSPLALLLHMADMEAMCIDEDTDGNFEDKAEEPNRVQKPEETVDKNEPDTTKADRESEDEAPF